MHQRICDCGQVLREHRDTLVSVMETFVHDPLCEWTQRKHQRSSAEEMDNPQAKDALATLEGAVSQSHPVYPLRLFPTEAVSCKEGKSRAMRPRSASTLHYSGMPRLVVGLCAQTALKDDVLTPVRLVKLLALQTCIGTSANGALRACSTDCMQ